MKQEEPMLESEPRVILKRESKIRMSFYSGVVCSVAVYILMLMKEANFGYKALICNIAEIFFSVFGVLYAIVVGLLIVDALRRLRDMSATIQDEVNTIEDAYECINYIDHRGDNHVNQRYKKQMVEALKEYVNSVINTEWKDMRNVKKKRLDRQMAPALTDFMKHLGGIRTEEYRNFIAVQALFGKMADLTSYRSKRRELALQVFHHPLHFLIKFMSAVIILGFLFLEVELLWVHIFIVCAITVSLFWLHVVIYDLDEPYDGYWKIENQPYSQVLEMLEERGGGNGQTSTAR